MEHRSREVVQATDDWHVGLEVVTVQNRRKTIKKTSTHQRMSNHAIIIHFNHYQVSIIAYPLHTSIASYIVSFVTPDSTFLDVSFHLTLS